MKKVTHFLFHSVALFALVVTTWAGAAPPSQTKPGAELSTRESNLPTSRIDINSATLTALRSLPGIGTANARKIVAGRPYTSVDDLKTRKVLPIKAYDRIRDRISAKETGGEKTEETPDMRKPSSAKHE